jgi:hypothetical protein
MLSNLHTVKRIYFPAVIHHDRFTTIHQNMRHVDLKLTIFTVLGAFSALTKQLDYFYR